MKALVLSDTHLGAQRYNLPWFKDVLRESFVKAFEIASDINVDFIIFTGDLFDTPFIEPNEILFALQTLKKFDLPVIAITGNHDLQTNKPYESSPIALLEESYEKFVVLKDNNVCFHYNDINFIGIPYISPLQFIEYRKHGLVLDRYHKYIDSQSLNIALLHQDLSVLDYAKHMWTSALHMNDIEPFDFSIIGHYHNRVEHEKFLYPGSTYPLSFKQSNVDKGIYQLNIDDNSITYNFIPLKHSKTLKEIRVSYPINDVDNIFQEATSDVVKLIVSVDESMLQDAVNFIRHNIRPKLSKQLDKLIVDFDINETLSNDDNDHDFSEFTIERNLLQLIKLIDEEPKYVSIKELKELLHHIDEFTTPYKSLDKKVAYAIQILQQVVGV